METKELEISEKNKQKNAIHTYYWNKVCMPIDSYEHTHIYVKLLCVSSSKLIKTNLKRFREF